MSYSTQNASTIYPFARDLSVGTKPGKAVDVVLWMEENGLMQNTDCNYEQYYTDQMYVGEGFEARLRIERMNTNILTVYTTDKKAYKKLRDRIPVDRYGRLTV